MAGKWVLYTFGASWCEPCHKELPAWDSVAPKLAGKVLFIAVNINNDQAEGEKFIKSLGLKHMFPVFLPDENSAALKAYDPDKMPSTFVIDPEGVVRIVQLGYKKGDEAQLAATLAELAKYAARAACSGAATSSMFALTKLRSRAAAARRPRRSAPSCC